MKAWRWRVVKGDFLQDCLMLPDGFTPSTRALYFMFVAFSHTHSQGVKRSELLQVWKLPLSTFQRSFDQLRNAGLLVRA